MYQQKKSPDYRSLWIISMVILVVGIVLTIRLALLRPLGFILLGVGGFGIVWSLVNMDRWNDRRDRDEPRHFN